jgi:hypothetical protein
MSVLRKVDGKQNATLAASAPDLYAALLAIAEGVERDLRLSVDPNHPISRDTLANRAAAARAAIARATNGGGM